MKERLAHNWKNALSEVLASIIGTLGIVLSISFILSLQAGNSTSWASTWESFSGYFRGGQIGLPILSLSGIIFIALKRHGSLGSIISVLLYAFFLVPIMITAFVVGLNPGFQGSVLTQPTLTVLWVFFFGLHFLWFLILILEPKVPSPQEAGREQESRVSNIKPRTAGRS